MKKRACNFSDMSNNGLAKQAVSDIGNPKDFSEQVDILTERFSLKDDIVLTPRTVRKDLETT